MEANGVVPVIREQSLWLTEEEAFTLLLGLVRGAAVGSRVEDSLLEKTGELCRTFMRGARLIPVEEAPEEAWIFDPCEAGGCLQAA
jgi:hypothetical protein